MRKLFAVPVLLLFISCSKSDRVPENVISPEKMQLVFWDYIRADAFTKEFIKMDSVRRDTIENMVLQQKIFGYYKISRDDFYRSYHYYTDHPELMNTIMDSIIARQGRKKLTYRIEKQ